MVSLSPKKLSVKPNKQLKCLVANDTIHGRDTVGMSHQGLQEMSEASVGVNHPVRCCGDSNQYLQLGKQPHKVMGCSFSFKRRCDKISIQYSFFSVNYCNAICEPRQD